ncbi:acyl-CoA thioesterase [Beijerinckia indica]|uniref:Thioesterase superfamily protein n=1 Tax=Beijerinckia indica subsp. indica (strain ATCC 9039 / DSM 1715 / NCIMB 8712) TaxID=395963 RepID=B2IFD4_BEII9|nr:thioesterase family protein [Beijerinckia indica]ACB97034.1 thioesterase superfamily protein [Beijerinckia indica subsp. indica ATCC 9039]
MKDEVRLDDFPLHASDKIRFGDTDSLGHINNAVFATFLETGRAEILCDPRAPLAAPGTVFVLARLVLDFRAEITWPGEILIGTRIAGVGRSSIRLEQALFQNERCVATSETVIVLMDEMTRRSTPLASTTVEWLASLLPQSTAS